MDELKSATTGGVGDLQEGPIICGHMECVANSASSSNSQGKRKPENPATASLKHFLLFSRSRSLVIMVLDPLSAFSLACNVLQIVETSLRVLGQTAECYNNGASDEVSIIVGNLHTIRGLNDELQDITPDPLGGTQLSSAELRLAEANQECLRLSGDFILLLDSLKVTKKSVWQSLSTSMKTMWYRDRLAGLEKAVSESRVNLTLAFLLLMHERSSTMHSSAITATVDIESHIIDTFKLHTSSLVTEVGKLTSCLNDLSLDYNKKSISEFSLLHHTQLVHLSEQLIHTLERQRASDDAMKSLEDSRHSEVAQHRLLHSLQYQQMQERREEISSAYENTYEWLFQGDPRVSDNDWHSFMTWTRGVDNAQRIYWIQGKPGSGKSTLSRFIYERLDVYNHLQPWVDSRAFVKAAHFFWNPGSRLQKSWIGMLRSLLFQLLDQVPKLGETCVSPSRWRIALSPNAFINEWTESELVHGIHAFVRTTDARILFLIDGLDEIQGHEEQKEQLISFVHDLAAYKNAKVCISSRADNIFQDAFSECPHLKLETMTYSDIQRYVTKRFDKTRRLQDLSQGNAEALKDLITFLVDAAHGVFLWVKLVVHELLRAARDGSTFPGLVDKAHKIPGDLDSYFSRFIESISAEYRQEASHLFQIVLHNEHALETLPGLRLLDLSHAGASQEALHSQGMYNFATFDPENIAELHFRLDTTARRINSRCRGLIECKYVAGDEEALFGFPMMPESSGMGHEALQNASPNHIHNTIGLLRACNRHVVLIHRSLRDFLISPKSRQTLHNYSRGPFSTRLFLSTARLSQIRSLNYAQDDIHGQMALGLASYVLSAIATDELKCSDESALIAAQLRPIVETLGRTQIHEWSNLPWYLCKSFRDSETEAPDFLTVAIDFDLVAYLKNTLTTQTIRDKQGLSVLSCILIGRFSNLLGSEITIGNRFPNIEVLRLALKLGANPNESWLTGISVWAKYLEHVRLLPSRVYFRDSLDVEDCGYHHARHEATRWTPPADAQKAHIEALRALLEYGAAPELPYKWLTSIPFELRPGSRSDLIPVSVALKEMLGLYSHARQELQECIQLANDKLIQARAQH